MNKLLLKYKQKSEAELLKAYLKGDKLAFFELYVRHTDKLVGFFMMKCNNDLSLCNDLVQDTYHNLLESSAFKGNSINDFSSYIIRIAFNTWSTYSKKKKVQEENKRKLDEINIKNSVSEECNRSEYWYQMLELSISQLPTKEQIAVIELLRDGKSYEEIAKAMDKTVDQVRSLLYRAKKNLQRLTGK